MTPHHILALRSGAVGDVIVTFPVLQVIRARWPKASIDLIAPPATGRLARDAGLANLLHSIDDADCAELYAPTPLSETWCDYLARFDLVLNFLHDPAHIVAGHLKTACRGLIINHSPLVQTGHAIDHFLKPLAALGIVLRGNEFPRLPLLRKTIKPSGIAIHPGSGSPAKNWPLSNFIALGRMLGDHRYGKPVFICGEAESAITAPLRKEFSSTAVLHGQNLDTMATFLAGCAGYIGNDSGISHLAAAVGTPAVVLFGPSSASVWAPRGPHVRVISATTPTTAALSAIEPRDVLQSLALLLRA